MDAWDLLVQGKIFESMLYNYTSLMGSSLFFTILLGILVALIYIKTRSIELISVTIMLGGIVLIPVVEPNTRVYFLAVSILGAAIGIYNVLWRRYFGD